MCLSSPKIEAQAPVPPPSQNTQALASPYDEDLASNLSQLRMGSRANLAKARKAAAAAAGGAAPSAGSSDAPAGPVAPAQGSTPSLRIPSYGSSGGPQR